MSDAVQIAIIASAPAFLIALTALIRLFKVERKVAAVTEVIKQVLPNGKDVV